MGGRKKHGGNVKMSTGVKNSKQATSQQAQWNVQVVRGKVTTRCLWNACKALSIGLLLLTIGTTMAVIGYYADQLSIRSETRGNSTVRIKNESRGFHLNNLSYAGPIVMGIGGFIVVAACVMTFEARDSAAKVVPARFKPNLNSSIAGESTKSVTPRNSRKLQKVDSKRSASVQTPGGGKVAGMYKVESTGGGSDWSPKTDSVGRKAFTAAFVQFSRELMENAALESEQRWKQRPNEGTLNKSPSAPDLAAKDCTATQEGGRNDTRRLPFRGSPKGGSRSQRESDRSLGTVSSNLLLRPSYLHRQALSMDNPFYDSYECCTPPMKLSRQHSRKSGGSKESFEMELGSSAGVTGSQVSMALDLHDCQVTLKVKDESASRRSDTSRRHQLLRQKPVEDDIVSRCSCIPRFLCTPVEECSIRTKSSTSLKSPCHRCLKPGSCCGKGHNSKITPDFRSQSFSQTYVEPKKCTFQEDARIFCIDDHRRRTNLSSENIRVCCEEKLRCLRRQSPCVSPLRSPKCRAHDAGCVIHSKEGPWVCGSLKRKNSNHKIECSLSAEEHGQKARKVDKRSASFSPTTASPIRECAKTRKASSSPVSDAKPKEEAETDAKEPS